MSAEEKTIRLLSNTKGVKRFSFDEAYRHLHNKDDWRDAFGDYHRASDRRRDEIMMREFRR